jgi:hypothetical protein
MPSQATAWCAATTAPSASVVAPDAVHMRTGGRAMQ